MKKESIKNGEIAFKDFKNAVPLNEFESVLKIARHEYDMLSSEHSKRMELIDKIMDAAEQVREQSVGMPKGLAKKILKELVNRAVSDIPGFKGAIKRHIHITDFLNRFQERDKELPYLNFNFKSQIRNGII